MYQYIETHNNETKEVVKRTDVSDYSERVASTFVNATNNGIRDNKHYAKLTQSETPLEIIDVRELQLN